MHTNTRHTQKHMCVITFNQGHTMDDVYVCVCVCVYLGVNVCVFVTAMPRTQNSTEDTQILSNMCEQILMVPRILLY